MLAVGAGQHWFETQTHVESFRLTFASTQAAILSKMGTALASCGGDKGSEATAAVGAAIALRWRGSLVLAGLQAAKGTRCRG